MDEGRQPLSRKLPIPSSKINPYRIIIILRLVILGLFFHYRILHPVNDAYGLWLTSVICEIWFAVSWIMDQFPKWYPITRETYLDRLSLRYLSHVYYILIVFFVLEVLVFCSILDSYIAAGMRKKGNPPSWQVLMSLSVLLIL